MIKYSYIFFLFLTIFLKAGIALAQVDYYSAGGKYVGTLTRCDDIRVVSSSGITGGTAGFIAGPEISLMGATSLHKGGGPSFNYTYECAGLKIVAGIGIGDWPDFDAPSTYTQSQSDLHYKSTTRDLTRGRAGHDFPLFMDAHDICRRIDNTAGSIQPVFMGASTEEEWRTVHGVAIGANPNGGYSHFANNPSLPFHMDVCCAPVLLEICGSLIPTGYTKVGDIISVVGADGGYGEVQCISNNTYQPVQVIGICDSGGVGGGGVAGAGTAGYSNPSTGGQISQADWGGLSSTAQSDLSAAGYGPADVTDTNAVGAADMAAASQEAAEQTDAENKAEDAAEDAEDSANDAESDHASDV